MSEATKRLQSVLESVPHKDAWSGAHTAIVTFWCDESARRFCQLLIASGLKHKGPVKSVDYKKTSEGRAKSRSDLIQVWRVGITW